jgi:hypothetical protein
MQKAAFLTEPAMDEDVAKLIFAAIMGVGVMVWTFSLHRALRLGLVVKQPDPLVPDEDAEVGKFESQSGTVTLRGDPQALSKALVRSLVQLQFGLFASVFKIREYEDGRIALKKIGPLVCNMPPGLHFTEAEISFERTNQGTVQVSYRLGYARLVRLLRKIALCFILVIGLPTIFLVGAIVWLLVIPSPIPGVRWQVLQTLQIGHALWPPFMFMWFYSLGRRQSRTLIENVISSIEMVA